MRTIETGGRAARCVKIAPRESQQKLPPGPKKNAILANLVGQVINGPFRLFVTRQNIATDQNHSRALSAAETTSEIRAHGTDDRTMQAKDSAQDLSKLSIEDNFGHRFFIAPHRHTKTLYLAPVSYTHLTLPTKA